MSIYNFDDKISTNERINLTIHSQSEDIFNKFLIKYSIDKKFNLKKKKIALEKQDYDFIDNTNDDLIINDLFITIKFQVCEKQKEIFKRLENDFGKFSKYIYLYKKNEFSGKFITEGNIKHKYPIYIISKGRPNNCYTADYLEKCNIDFKIVVEPSEYSDYNFHYDFPDH